MQKVLIVDDEVMVLKSLSKIIESSDIEVKSLETGEEALSEIRSKRYNLCFLDIHLPGCSGLKVMKAVKELSPHTYVVMMTSGMLNREVEREIEETADCFLPKPFDRLQIKMIIKEVCSKQHGE